MRTIRWLLVLLVTFVGAADANEIKFSLVEKYNALEKYTNRTTYFSFDTKSGKLRTIRHLSGVAQASEGPFKISERNKLVLGAKQLTDAGEILFQGRAGNSWVVIITDEHNSLSPLYWLAALSGHPIQVTKVLIVTVREGRLVFEREVTSKGASYDWQASVMGE